MSPKEALKIKEDCYGLCVKMVYEAYGNGSNWLEESPLAYKAWKRQLYASSPASTDEEICIVLSQVLGEDD